MKAIKKYTDELAVKAGEVAKKAADAVGKTSEKVADAATKTS